MTVMKVTERLASLSIEENVNERALLAEGTNQFLDTQLDSARRQLVEQEQKLEAYRKRYAGRAAVAGRPRTFRRCRTCRCRFSRCSSRSTATAIAG